MYAAVVPTLQRSPLLARLLDDLADHDLVDEILVVNNAAEPLAHPSPKVRILSPGRNIYVNPAWNLGVAETTSPRLLIVNDDVVLPRRLLAAAGRRLDRGAGIIGPHKSCYRGGPTSSWLPLRFWPTWWRTWGFGSLMLMDRSSWVPIPDDLLIYFGDDYLLRQQTGTCYRFSGVRLATGMGATTSDQQFTPIFHSDFATFRERYPEDPYRLRHWKRYRLARMRQRARIELRRRLRLPATADEG